MDREGMKNRTKEFAKLIILLCSNFRIREKAD
jgi:hypothetical protein